VFLKSIELFGFKSFADKSRIEFTDGISALLGPNGCGKSNIVDAIKWVLGEQATKSLRAARMDDVIFNGTENRKPLNVAEVSLTLANVDGILPIDVEEFTVRRRLFRSGESEYYINNNLVRLKEVKELFYDTGIGKSAYSIMEQGKIDQILSNKPEERRYIFEEAASITKFKMKSQEAERKLEKTEENMRQIAGIIGEVKRSYDSLSLQSGKTIQYRELKDRIFELEKDLHLLKLRTLNESKAKREEQFSQKTEHRTKVKTKIDNLNETVEGDLDIVNEMESELVDIQKKLYGIELEKSNRERQLKILTEQVIDAENKIESDERKNGVFLSKIAKIEESIIEKELSMQELNERLEEVHKNIQLFRENIEHTKNRIHENDEQIRKLEQSTLNLEKMRVVLQEELHALTENIVTELDKKLNESGSYIKERNSIEEDIETQLGELNILLMESNTPDLIERLKNGIKNLENLVSELRQTIPVFLDDFISPEGIITQKRKIDEKIKVGTETIENNRNQVTILRDENIGHRKKSDEYRRTLEELKVSEVKMVGQLASIRDTRSMLQREVREQKNNLEELKDEIEFTKSKLGRANRQISEIKTENSQFDADKKMLQQNLAKVEKGITARNNALKNQEDQLKKLMADLGTTHDQLEKIQIGLTEINSDIKNIYSNFTDKFSRVLEEFESRMFDIQDAPAGLREKLNRVKEDLRNLGSVNLMAPEEFEEVKERYNFLTSQLDDLKKARTDLVKVTGEIRAESAQLFLATYDKIKKNFHVMFRRLFGGGRAELRLSDPDNVLESGIEIYAQPPGKKLENITLLSGGERALTGVSLLFATYMVKPSPFCLLDEIDAALDESNVGRFINMLMEFGKSSQFIIVTHNKKTVTGAKTLLGVTMEESGVSKIVAIRLDKSREVEHVHS
jgi:chromosome segregation protein